MKQYRVTYARDSIDPNPPTREFMNFIDVQDWIFAEVDERIGVDRTHEEFENEMTLVTIKEL